MTGREQLAEYIGKEPGARAAFARRAGISESHLSLFLQDKKGLSIESAQRVFAATEGHVPLEALLPANVAKLLGAA